MAQHYHLEGRLLEVCDCGVLCPCWIGEDPDNGTCDSALAYRIDRGTIEGLDVSGLTFALAAHIPGKVLRGGFRVVPYVADPARALEAAGAFRGEALVLTHEDDRSHPVSVARDCAAAFPRASLEVLPAGSILWRGRSEVRRPPSR